LLGYAVYKNAAMKAPTPATAPPTARIVAAAPDADDDAALPVGVPFLSVPPVLVAWAVLVGERMMVVLLFADTVSVMVELFFPATTIVFTPGPTAGIVATSG